MKIAFAGDYEICDQHFGSARSFQIYEISPSGESAFIERRLCGDTGVKCQGNCEGGLEGGFGRIIEVVSDCEAIFVAKIGEGAAAYCISKGKRVFESAGEIDEIIRRLANEPSLLFD